MLYEHTQPRVQRTIISNTIMMSDERIKKNVKNILDKKIKITVKCNSRFLLMSRHSEFADRTDKPTPYLPGEVLLLDGDDTRLT